MLKQINARPRKGQWVEMWEHNGVSWSGSYKVDGGDIFEFNPDSNEWRSFGRLRSKANRKFYISVSPFKKIEFRESWQLLKWLQKNEGTGLYSGESDNNQMAWYEDGYYRLSGFSRDAGLFRSHLIKQKTWYLKESG